MLNIISQIFPNVNFLLHGSDPLDFDNNKIMFDAVHKFIEYTDQLRLYFSIEFGNDKKCCINYFT